MSEKVYLIRGDGGTFNECRISDDAEKGECKTVAPPDPLPEHCDAQPKKVDFVVGSDGKITTTEAGRDSIYVTSRTPDGKINICDNIYGECFQINPKEGEVGYDTQHKLPFFAPNISAYRARLAESCTNAIDEE